MRRLFIPLALAASLFGVHDAYSGSFSTETNPVQRITKALISSGRPEFTPRVFKDGDQRFSYQLVSVRFLGTIAKKSEVFSVATAFFLRSSAEGAEHPPARGHGFILLLDKNFKIASWCALDFPDQLTLEDGKLFRTSKNGRAPAGDLNSSNVSTRTQGFLIDHTALLGYPFSDRIKEP